MKICENSKTDVSNYYKVNKKSKKDSILHYSIDETQIKKDKLHAQEGKHIIKDNEWNKFTLMLWRWDKNKWREETIENFERWDKSWDRLERAHGG